MLGTDKLLKEDCARAGHAVYRDKFNTVAKLAKPLTGTDEMDPVTGDPVWRYIPCREGRPQTQLC